MKLEKFFQTRVGDGGGGDDGRIFPEHPGPILHAPRDIISRKGKSLTPICQGFKQFCQELKPYIALPPIPYMRPCSILDRFTIPSRFVSLSSNT